MGNGRFGDRDIADVIDEFINEECSGYDMEDEPARINIALDNYEQAYGQ